MNEMNEIGTGFEDCRPQAFIALEGVMIKGLLDSGATISALGKDCLQFLNKIQKDFQKISSHVKTADGTKQQVLGFVMLNVEYKDFSKLHKFFLIPSLSKPLYLGIDFWRSFQIAPELHQNSEICDITLDIDSESPVDHAHNLSKSESEELQRVVSKFPCSTINGLGHTSYIQHRIDTDSAEPINSRHYPVSPNVQKLMYDELDRMIGLGVIEPAESPWNSPVVLVRKPGKNRLCLDSRKLNSVTKKLAYPLPNINGLLSRLADTVYISSIDLKDAFWQIELHPASREKTAFTVPGRPQYQFKVMPFGLCNAAQRLCQLMDMVLPAELRHRVFVYLDDLLVVSSTFPEHLKLLSEVADRLKRAGLTVNVSKSRFCYTQVKYLGHIVGHGSIKPDPGKVSAISEFKIPSTVRQVRRFLGMCGYYSKFISNYSSLCSPLTDVISKTRKFNMTPEAIAAFEKLKQLLISEPVLVHPDFNRPFEILIMVSALA